MKNILVIIGMLLFIPFAYGQKSIIDDFLDQNPGIREKATTCVNIAPEMLSAFYKESTLPAPERYQSLSICDAHLSASRFEQVILAKNYVQIMSQTKKDGGIVKYYQRKNEKRRDTSTELLVCMQHHNDFSVIYLKGENLKTPDLKQHLQLIRNHIEQNTNIN